MRRKPVSILPLEVVQRIASGEVIYDYTSVVQELVENSLDAKSTDIRVDVDLTARSVTVSDNGEGVDSVEDLLKIVQCNATSKLSSLDELQNGVSTLGFRGQGLWAIAASAESLTISSRPPHRSHGYSLRFAQHGHSLILPPTPAPMSRGTVVSAIGLPWTLSGTHRTNAFRRCKLFLFRMALTHSDILFRLSRGGRPVWSSTYRADEESQGSSESRTAAVLARHVGVPVSSFRSGVYNFPSTGSVSIVIGTPSTISLSSGESMVVAINGRPIRNDSINRIITAACTLQRGRFPAAFVGIETSPCNVNWNVCPSKSRMRFLDENMNTRLVNNLKNALSDLLSATLVSYNALDEREASELVLHQPTSVVGLLTSMQRRAMESELSSEKVTDSLEATKIERGMDHESSGIGMFGSRVVAQVLNTYILVEHRGGIMLIEQHVADERAIYENLCDSWNKKAFVCLEDPVRLSSDVSDEILFRLSTLGLEAVSERPRNDDECIEKTSPGYSIERVPKILASLAPEDLKRLILRLGREDISIEGAAADVSCRLAVRNGRALDDRKMKAIVKNLFACSNAHTCPHGRPIFHEVGTTELAALFKRSWNPEKPSVTNDVNHTRRRLITGVIKKPHSDLSSSEDDKRV